MGVFELVIGEPMRPDRDHRVVEALLVTRVARSVFLI